MLVLITFIEKQKNINKKMNFEYKEIIYIKVNFINIFISFQFLNWNNQKRLLLEFNNKTFKSFRLVIEIIIQNIYYTIIIVNYFFS